MWVLSLTFVILWEMYHCPWDAMLIRTVQLVKFATPITNASKHKTQQHIQKVCLNRGPKWHHVSAI
jgi:hypothetical protein